MRFILKIKSRIKGAEPQSGGRAGQRRNKMFVCWNKDLHHHHHQLDRWAARQMTSRGTSGRHLHLLFLLLLLHLFRTGGLPHAQVFFRRREKKKEERKDGRKEGPSAAAPPQEPWSRTNLLPLPTSGSKETSIKHRMLAAHSLNYSTILSS